MDQRRRQILKLVGCSGLAALAGCSNSGPGDSITTSDTANTDDRRDVTPEAGTTTASGNGTATPAAYQEWLVPPTAFAGREHYFFNTVNYGQLQSVQTELDDGILTRIQSNVGMEDFTEFGIDFSDISNMISLRPMAGASSTWNVILGSFSKNAITEAFTDSLSASDPADATESNGHSSTVSTEDKGEYTLYSRGGSGGAVALADGVILLGTNTETDSTTNVESLIDANAGDTGRYGTQSDDMATIISELGSGTFLGGGTSETVTQTNPESGVFEGQVGYGYADTIRGDMMETQEVFLFDAETSVNMNAMTDYTDIELFDDFSRNSASQNGRVVLVTGEVPTADIYGYSNS